MAITQAERWNELKTLFGRALDLDPRERSSFVAAVTAGDPDLERSLRSLLAHHQTAATLLDGPILSQERIAEYLAAELRTFREGEIVGGRFRIVDFLGEGGMGEVYRAEDLELGGEIALKTLRPVLSAHESLIRQLRQETYTAQRVTHRNVCRIYDLFRHSAGEGQTVVFITMEFLNGVTLSRRIREQGGLRLAQALPIAEQILQGLEAAHQAGIVHRDLKSGNVLLVKEQASVERVVITDFGLACASQDNGVAVASRTAGTPAYAAPEQLLGEAPTAAADLYSFGVLLFEMVTGALPFPVDTLADVAARRTQSVPSLRKLVPGLDSRWVSVIQACLEREPSNRPASAAAVIRQLRSHAVTRRRFVATAAMAAGAAGGWWYIRRPEPLHPEAVQSFRRGQDFAKRRNEEGLKNAVAEFQRAVQIEPNFAEAWVGMADAYSAIANFDLMPPKIALRSAREAARKGLSLDRNSGRALGVMGYVTSLDVQQWHTAEPYFVKAVAADPKDPMIRLWYGAHLSKLGRSEEALRQLRAGLELDPMSLVLNQQLATEFFRRRSFDEYYKQAKELVRLQPFEPSSHLALARALEFLKRYDQALAECAEAEKYSGAVTSVCFRGLIAAAMGDAPAARLDAQRVHQYWSTQTFQSALLASLYARIGNGREAIDVLNKGFDRGDSTVLTAPTTPYFDALHGDAEYARFLQRIGWGH